MKKSVLTILVIAATFINAKAYDLRDILGSLSTSDIAGAISSTIQNATATTSFSLDELVGIWKYSTPGVSFASDNALQKIGGAAAATAVENKLAPYYKRVGINNLTLTVDNQHNFTMKMKLATLRGTITKDNSGNFTFNFKALSNINIGKVNCMATKSGSLLNLTFDAHRLIEILKKVSAVAKNSTFTSVTNLLSSYDGIYVGVKLKKQ